MEYDNRYLTFMGRGPKVIPHWEHWSCPDADTYLTGINYYKHPRQSRLKLQELYPQLGLGVPEKDDAIPEPDENASVRGGDGTKHYIRWGTSVSGHWDWGKKFKTADDVFSFSPLKQGDFSEIPVVESADYSDEEKLYQRYRKNYPAEWGDKAPEGSTSSTGFYNTMFMWPLLTFGWELFLETCLDERFGRIMDEFAEINRRVFRTFARLPVNFVICHDDIVNSRGPVCSPAWMKKYIFPRYEEFWSIVKNTGKRVVFMSDGCIDAFVEDIFACGASGIVTEPYTDFKKIARRHENCVLAGEGDNRILSHGTPDDIKRMVFSMVETAQMTGGYFMCIGNHVPWDIPPESIKLYLDLSKEFAQR